MSMLLTWMRGCCIGIILLQAFGFPSVSAETETANSFHSTITLIAIPALSFEEFEDVWLQSLPNLRFMLQHSGLAAMNIRTNGKGLEDLYVSMGAGSNAVSYADYHAMNRNDRSEEITASELYHRYNGSLPVSGDILVPAIGAVQAANAKEHPTAHPGWLGDTLLEANIPISVFSGIERPLDLAAAKEATDPYLRYAPLMLMNSKGIVPHGSVSASMALRAPDYPQGYKQNYAELLFSWKEAVRQSTHSVVLIELGDLYRLYKQKGMYAPDQFIQIKRSILQDIDQFLGELLAELQMRQTAFNEVQQHGFASDSEAAQAVMKSDEIWLFSPKVHSEASKARRLLAPFIKFDAMQQGLLFSGTTRRAGLISYVDIAPTLLQHFDIVTDAAVQGQLIQRSKAVPEGTVPLDWLLQEEERMSKVYKLRPQLLYPFVTFEIIVLALSLAVIVLRWQRTFKWLKVLLYAVLIAPFTMLVMGWMVRLTSEQLIFAFVILTFMGALALFKLRPILAIGWIAFITGVSIVLDGLYGAYGMKHSILGYDPMIGARYYGIGNEYMGILIGCSLLAGAIGLDKWMRLERTEPAALEKDRKAMQRGLSAFYLLLYLFIIFYFISPQWGTNAGGAITATVAFGICWIRMWGIHQTKRVHLLTLLTCIAGFGLIALAGLWLVNHFLIANESEQSHIGRAFDLLMSGRMDMIANMIWRKLEMNLHLIGVSSWSKVLITSILIIAAVLLNPTGYFRQWQQERPYMMYGFSAISVGSITALIVNDSGIVAAATMIVYAAVPMLLLRMKDLQQKQTL